MSEGIPPAPYLPTARPDVVESTTLARAGWYSDGQHGGVVAALIGREIERVPTLAPMEVARLTVELFRVVRVVPLRLESRIVREGKKIQVVEVSVFDDEAEVARGVGLRLRTTEVQLPTTARPQEPALVPPQEALAPDMRTFGIGAPGRVLFHRHAVEVRELDPGFATIGPGGMWMRITRPLVAGEALSPLVRATIVGDFVNGLSRLDDSRRWSFMNADLSIHLQRHPEGEWIGVSAESRWEAVGRGVAAGVLHDIRGEFGRSTQSLFLEPTP
ncbi:MAG TPA: thioesterase family protein [Acidimicrobiia bacterium]|nr:thioesterase family protein [Acidimicrobiia bacterium]